MNKPPEFTEKCCLSSVLCLVIQLRLTLCNSIDCSLPGSSVHGDSPSKNTGAGCYILLQGIFPTQGIKSRVAYPFSRGSCRLRNQTRVSCIAGDSLRSELSRATGNPFQDSCLENPRDRGAWWAAVYGVTQSRT